ncbi:Ldh family oxidoreductase [Paraburkholderia caballeronis]|uniref:Malate/lactate/ureidoglycolate dehydrogenase, LDH2 family n=1 Tax=Paraburkholderia caballeronis TaxID=416943 RepID=A0A1H7UGD5_9BURK|nr:Ldh family oxidoreductase [Paraburkholderia caballeronis]PXW17542.1 LDH2 family malate/lactate/ureidoglycolate dehydrogenase [Paraburkholderia caballeronis]PXW95131.1 LDH2 family malate/lactate/ureidoglycolate dehydrogenase [Paraburkholderia caballeronis]RAJ90977.1 LDH2 family malate/lactate/ureidoglycolate dehydrogenase [Paraburkholderia caballeronis]SEE19772.1 Malate/lactate/ureidoglycolate dehydrogenase, LDH2 family [Paraburkholderia caballeronis]SEL95826.1 Malate/lactate/ureidoglycolate
MSDESTEVVLSLDELFSLSRDVLMRHGASPAHADAISRVIVQGQRDECHSHGLYRLLGCVRSIRSGKVDPRAEPTLRDLAPGVLSVDANYGFSLLAFETGLPRLAEKARSQGLAAMAIKRCFHFSALWPEVEAIAALGLVGLAMNPSHSWVAPEGGKRPVFGTNPIAFAWPRPDGDPFVFDFATSAIARGDIELHAREGKPIPEHWAFDRDGAPTTDARAALDGAMRTFGGHKGSALAAMVELLAGALIGDLTSMESQAFDAGAGASPCHGELVIAIDPRRFLGDDAADGHARAERLFDAVTGQGARLPSQRRFEARARSERDGVRIPGALYRDVLAL